MLDRSRRAVASTPGPCSVVSLGSHNRASRPFDAAATAHQTQNRDRGLALPRLLRAGVLCTALSAMAAALSASRRRQLGRGAINSLLTVSGLAL